MLKRNSAKRRAVLLVGGFLAGSLMVVGTTTLAPLAANAVATAGDAAVTSEDTSVVIPVLANDSNLPLGYAGCPGTEQPSRVVSVTDPANGAAIIGPIAACNFQTVTYTPDPNFSGVDSFNYTACDNDPVGSFANCTSATVTVTVNAVNDPPVANPDALTAVEDGGFGPLVNLVANDSDPEGIACADSVSIVGAPVHGVITLSGPCLDDASYDPTQVNYSGPDTATYMLCDTGVPVQCDTATISITVLNVNDPPTANVDIVNMDTSTTVNVKVTDNDFDPDGDTLYVTNLLPVSLTGVAGLAEIGAGNTSVNVTSYGEEGLLVFPYEVSDPSGATDTSAVVAVVCNPDPAGCGPTAIDDAQDATEDIAFVDIPVLANDYDAVVPYPPLEVVWVENGTAGTTSIVGANDTVRYMPNPNFNGHDEFDYVVCNANNECASATVQVQVTPVNDVPDGADDFIIVPEDSGPTAVGARNNDFDEDQNDTAADGGPGPQSTYVDAVSNPANGSAEMIGSSPPVDVQYTPDPDFEGADSFVYSLCDSFDPPACDDVTVNVWVNAVNDPIDANNDFYFTPQDTAAVFTDITSGTGGPGGSVGPFANDTDVEDLPAAYLLQSTTNPLHGTLAIGPNYYQWTYTPNAGYTGGDSFTYTVCDTDGACDTATVFISVGNTPESPVAIDDVVVIPEGTPFVDIDVLANDADPDGDPLVVANLGGPPPIGSIAIVANKVRFTPTTPDTNGMGGFTYQACDPGPLCATATVFVWITPVNDAPVAVDDVAVTPEDTPHGVNPILNDTDVDGNPLSLLSITQPAHGTTQITGVNIVTYTPAANYNGPDSYTYVVSDGNGGTDTGTVFYTVTPVDDLPTAVNDFVSTPEDTQVTIFPLTNDISPDGLPMTIVLLGPLPVGSTGFIFGDSIKWTPAPNFTGIAGFTYTMTDPDGDASAATIFVNVSPGANDAPVAVDDVAVTAEDTPHGVNPILNDTDGDGDVLSLSSITQPAHGVAQITGPNVVTYTPAANYNGPDSYTYTVVDGNGGSDVGTVFYTVSPVDEAPVALDDFVATPEDTLIIISPLTNDTSPDGPPLTLTSLGPLPVGSSAFIFGNTVHFTPAPNFTGLAAFTYTVTDPDGDTDTATIWVDVSPGANDIPVANNDFVGTLEDTPHAYTGPATNDTDGDGNPLTVVAITVAPSHGTALITGPNTVLYTPAPNYNGPDSYQYQISDGQGGSAWAWVNYVVLPVDDFPIAVDDFTTTPEDTQVTIFVLANDLSPDGPPLTLTGLGPLPVGSSAFIFGDTIKFTPAPNFVGVAGFTYTITDPDGDTDTGSVFVEVTANNGAPIANDDITSTPEDTPKVINILANDVEPDGEALTIFPGLAGHGLVSVAPAGFITYTPFLNYNGPDSFTYVICDPSLACDSATVTVQVTPVNDPPEGNADVASTTLGVPVTIQVLLNDSDIDGGPLTVTLVSVPTGGIAVIGPGGTTINYTPPAAPGVYTFTYNISDGLGGVDTLIPVTVFVNFINVGPIVLNDAWSTPEDTAVFINLLINDVDPPPGLLGPLTVTWVTQAAHGNVTVNPTVTSPGFAKYIPDPQFNGHDYFSYTVCNKVGQCAVGQVVVTVESVNDVPVARDDLVIIPEDATFVDIQVLSNDTDEDMGDGAAPNPAQYIYVNAITVPPTNGLAVIVGTGPTSYIRYTPNPDYNGPDSFEYQICDSFDYPATPPAGSPGDCDTATVVINVKTINDPPVAVDDFIATPEDTPSFPFNPAANDFDPDGPVPNLTQVLQPSHGTVSVVMGLVIYTPFPNYVGNDSFNYQVCDAGGLCDWGTVWVTVGAVDDGPVANDDVASTQEEAPPITIDVLANDFDVDGDPLHIGSLTQPAAGGGIAWIQAGKIMYMPDLKGIWTFTYTACDNTPTDCDTATVTVYVSRKNNPPVGVNDIASTPEDTLVSIPVLANDFDPDLPADVLHIQSVTAPINGGQVVVNGANIDYTPALDFHGIDTFTYTVCDQLNACSGVVIVQVTVGAVPDNPVAVNDLYITFEDTPIVMDVLSNDEDPDNDLAPLRICRIVFPPALGIAIIQGSGANASTIKYTPGHGWNGHDQLTYEVGDGPCGYATTRFDTAVVDIIVLPVNQGVTAIDDIATTPVGEPVNIDVKANDFDGDNPPDPLTVKGVSPINSYSTLLIIDTASGNGKVTVNANNTIHYDPDYGFEGQDEFWYTVCDPFDACDTAHVVVSVGHADADANSISGYVYFDLNLNGTRDFGEPDVLGVKVGLYKAGVDGVFNTADDVLVEEGTIGNPYVFSHLPGNTTYQVRVDPSTVPPGFIYSDDPSGPLDGLAVIAMGFNSVYTDQNFGLVIGGDMPETH